MIRVYYYSGFVEVDGERMLKEPPLARWYEHNGWSDPAPEHTRIAAVYATNGGTYEVCHVNGHRIAADDMSPPLKEGWTYLPVGPGTQISVWEPMPAKPAKKIAAVGGDK